VLTHAGTSDETETGGSFEGRRYRLSWEQEQEKFILEARLLASSPDVVFEKLRKLSAKVEHPGFNDKHEVSLVERNERLINLGLATYGTNIEVLKALYRHGCEAAVDSADATYKKGLRLGCLANNSVKKAHFLYDYPEKIIGSEEIRRIIAHADGWEVSALILNPAISEELLQSLYERKEPFTQLPEERWLRLIAYSSDNERLVSKYEDDEGPDLGHFRIYKSILALLEKAPINYHSLLALYRLLDHLDFQQVRIHTPEHIELILERWARVEAPKKDRFDEGYYTALSKKDEFRCLIAALYGRAGGDCEADDVALRCAFYGNGDLTSEEMVAGYKRDDSTFVFAATLNRNVHQSPDLRRIMEEKYLDRYTGNRWLKYDKQIRRKWPNLVPPISQTILTITENKVTESKEPDAIAEAIAELQKSLIALTARVSEARQLMLVGAVVLILLIYFHAR
jgi:hypothetical protein